MCQCALMCVDPNQRDVVGKEEGVKAVDGEYYIQKWTGADRAK